MGKTSTINIRIDPELKSEVEAIYASFGITLTKAINIFSHQSRNVGGLPFSLCKIPNTETLEYMSKQFKEIIDKVCDGEKVLIPCPQNKNVVIITESEYNELERIKNNYLYEEKINKSLKQIAEGETVTFTMEDLRALEEQ